jgi:hypothetical protein
VAPTDTPLSTKTPLPPTTTPRPTTTPTPGYQVTDPVLNDAIVVAYSRGDPKWRPYADLAAKKNPRIQWLGMPPNVLGSWEPRTKTLAVSLALRSQYVEVLAAIITHGMFHAATVPDVPSPSWRPADCLQNEIDAYAWEADAWFFLHYRYVPRNGIESDLDAIRLAISFCRRPLPESET